MTWIAVLVFVAVNGAFLLTQRSLWKADSGRLILIAAAGFLALLPAALMFALLQPRELGVALGGMLCGYSWLVGGTAIFILIDRKVGGVFNRRRSD